MDDKKTVPLIGILGGIGSGKSSVIRQIPDLNLTILDADIVGHQVLEDPDIISRLTSEFGSQILDGNQVSRRSLSKVVFDDGPEQSQRLKTLNSIVHPEIRRRLYRQIASARQDSDAIILDASLLLEGKWDDHCDYLIFVDTDLETRKQRVRDTRSWDSEELVKREKQQIAVDVKRNRADFVVDNSGTLENSVAQMNQILGQILADHCHNT